MAGVLLGVSLGALALYAQRMFNMPGPLPATLNVVVPRGGLDPISERLLAQDVIAFRRNFQIAALLTRGEGPVRAGEFAFPAHASLREVLTVLRTARPVQHSLTIPEGLTGKQIQAILAHTEALSGPLESVEEGSLLPQTYQFELGTPPGAVLARARIAMARALQQEWAVRAPDLPLASAQEALVLASIVERETAIAEERPLIAAVFLNRLKRGMKLQSDPTVIYAASAGGRHAGPCADPRRTGPRRPVQHLPRPRPAARADLRARHRQPARGAASGRHRRSLFRRRRHRPACVCSHAGGA